MTTTVTLSHALQVFRGVRVGIPRSPTFQSPAQGVQERAVETVYQDCNEPTESQCKEIHLAQPFAKRRLVPCTWSKGEATTGFWGCPECFQQEVCACESLRRQLGVKVSGCYAQLYIQKFGVPERVTTTADERAANVQAVNGTLPHQPVQL